MTIFSLADSSTCELEFIYELYTMKVTITKQTYKKQ
jgi:hypothetical protein